MKGRAAWRVSTGLLDSSEGIFIPLIANPDRICVFRGVSICILSVFLEKKHVLLRCEPPGFFRETHVRISFTNAEANWPALYDLRFFEVSQAGLPELLDLSNRVLIDLVDPQTIAFGVNDGTQALFKL